jgi:hypothetical protein
MESAMKRWMSIHVLLIPFLITGCDYSSEQSNGGTTRLVLAAGISAHLNNVPFFNQTQGDLLF